MRDDCNIEDVAGDEGDDDEDEDDGSDVPSEHKHLKRSHNSKN